MQGGADELKKVTSIDVHMTMGMQWNDDESNEKKKWRLIKNVETITMIIISDGNRYLME